MSNKQAPIYGTVKIVRAALPCASRSRSAGRTNIRDCIRRPRQKRVVIYTAHAEEGSYRWCVTQGYTISVVVSLGDQVCDSYLCILSLRLDFAGHFFENLFFSIFLPRKLCAPPSDRERTVRISYTLHWRVTLGLVRYKCTARWLCMYSNLSIIAVEAARAAVSPLSPRASPSASVQ